MPVSQSSPRLTVALSVHNNAPFLDAAIASIRAQTLADFEFLIVDDGSSDGSGAIIDAHAARDPRIRAIHQPNRGLVASLNRLLAEARAPLVARMDGDDVALPERFEQQVAFLEAHPDHGVVGTRVVCIDGTGATRTVGTIDHPLDAAAVEAALLGGPLLCHPSVVMRRDLVRAVGGYRAAYRHCEDYDLWLRLAAVTRMANLPDRLLRYRDSPSQVSQVHVLEQRYGAAVARAAFAARHEGRPDPTDGRDRLPPIDELDELFAEPGLARAIRADLVEGILYAPDAIAGEGMPTLREHLFETRGAAGGRVAGLWRAAARVALAGKPAAAARLAWALARS